MRVSTFMNLCMCKEWKLSWMSFSCKLCRLGVWSAQAVVEGVSREVTYDFAQESWNVNKEHELCNRHEGRDRRAVNFHSNKHTHTQIYETILHEKLVLSELRSDALSGSESSQWTVDIVLVRNQKNSIGWKEECKRREREETETEEISLTLHKHAGQSLLRLCVCVCALHMPSI